VETDDAIIIHAFLEYDKALKDQKQEVLCGSTSGTRYLEAKYPEGKYWNEFYQDSKPIVYGHHVVGDWPKMINNTYGIDTGCCHGNYLTAIELPGFVIHQVKAKRDYWKEEQRIWQIPVLRAKNWNDMAFADIDKQLSKLAYIEEPEIVNYLAGIKAWKEELEGSYVAILQRVQQFAQQLLQDHGEHFSTEAGKHPCKSYIFKSRANNLTVEDLQKGLNTPRKLESCPFFVQ
jgi:serine/threonine protein phosphatase 1